MNTTIHIKDFTDNPGPALMKHGDFSGEEFRDTILLPALEKLYEENVKTQTENETPKQKLNISLNGVYGYSRSWLTEVFAGAVLMPEEPIGRFFCKTATLNCSEEPHLTEVIQDIVGDALSELDKLKKKSQKKMEENPSLLGMLVDMIM